MKHINPLIQDNTIKKLIIVKLKMFSKILEHGCSIIINKYYNQINKHKLVITLVKYNPNLNKYIKSYIKFYKS